MSIETQRRFVLIRYAQAEEADGADREAPLVDRRRKDASLTGRQLAGTSIKLDLAIVSPARRASETWKLIDTELSAHPRTAFDDAAYETGPGELIALLNIQDDVNNLVLVSHNPGIHALANDLAGEADGNALPRLNRSGFPTSAFAILSFTGSWKALEQGAARLVDFWAPPA